MKTTPIMKITIPVTYPSVPPSWMIAFCDLEPVDELYLNIDFKTFKGTIASIDCLLCSQVTNWLKRVFEKSLQYQ